MKMYAAHSFLLATRVQAARAAPPLVPNPVTDCTPASSLPLALTPRPGHHQHDDERAQQYVRWIRSEPGTEDASQLRMDHLEWRVERLAEQLNVRSFQEGCSPDQQCHRLIEREKSNYTAKHRSRYGQEGEGDGLAHGYTALRGRREFEFEQAK